MRQIARSLELNLAANSPSSGDAAARRQDLAALPHPVKRLIGLGLNSFTYRHRRAAETVLSGLSNVIGGARYLGNGATASVYKSGDTVLKVYRATILMSEAEQEEFIATRQALHNNLVSSLGEFVTPQTLAVDQHPLGDYRAVIGRQAYVSGGRLDLFDVNTDTLNRIGVSALCERQPAAQAELLALAEGTFISSDTGGVPDLNGSDNFRLVGPSETVLLIDADPVSRFEHPAVHDHILRQAEILEAFLTAA